MPNPVVPSRIKALIASVTGGLCERMNKLFQVVQLFYEDVAFKVDESGNITPAYKAMICALGCVGSGGGGGTEPPNPNMPAPGGVNATDGTYSDKVTITWNAVTAPTGIAAVTEYKIYRAAATVTDPTGAVLIATVTAPTLTYDDPVDGDLIVGTIYRYWVTATNGTDTSTYSAYNDGNAGAPVTSLDAIVDLRTTIGFGYGHICLVWTPPAGATKYDIYRHTVDDFSAAVKIYADVTPTPSTTLNHPTSNPTFWDNVGEVILLDTPMSGGVTPAPLINDDFFYWVVAKKDSPPGVSPESNSSLGRIEPPNIYNQTSIRLLYGDDTYTVDAGYAIMWATLFPSGGGGAGGNTNYGGGGGGGGGVVQEAFTVVPGDVITIVHTPSQVDSGNAAGTANGADGALTELKINGATVMTSQPGHGGQFNVAGSGAGGLGDTASGTATPIVYNGYAGLPGAGATGGRSGYFFSGRRMPAADATGPYNGNGLVGSGATRFTFDAAIAVGGSGISGKAYLKFGT